MNKHNIGSGKQKEGSAYIVLTLFVDDLERMLAAHKAESSYHSLKVIVAKKVKPGNYGQTHSVYVPVKEDTTEVVEGRVADQQELEVRAYDLANA